MRQIVIMPGGFHPFHAGHAELYKSAVKAFNNADVYVAATNDTKTRPFPFAIKEKLAKLAGVADKHFIQVKSPFKSEEITSHYNPDEDVLIFVRSEKDKTEQPKPGGTKKDGSPSYFQPYTGKNLQPFSKHAYIAYLPTVEFGPGITSATEIRNAWPKLDDRRKTAMVMSLYPITQKNPKLAANVVKMLDMGMGNELAEGWKDAVAGGAMALGALGAGAQTMPDINVQQVELANKYYNVLVQRAKEDGIKLDTRTLNVIKAKAQDAAAKKTQQSTPQQGFPSLGSERRVAKDASKFESHGVAEGRENYNGLNLLLQKDDEELFVKASAGGKELGHVLFVIDGDTLSPQDLEVDERYRGQGIAATMYDYVKSKGYKIRRSGQQTDAGAGFWDKHRPKQNVWEQELDEGPFVQRITNPKKVSIYLKLGKGSKLVATDIPYEILDKYINKVIQKYPQFKPDDFSFAQTDKINEFALPGGDDREPDEEEILRKLASQWWLGTEQQMAKAQRTLELMGWEIGQDESGDDDAGVFVIRAGDENGNSYIAFPHSALSLDDINEDYLEEN